MRHNKTHQQIIDKVIKILAGRVDSYLFKKSSSSGTNVVTATFDNYKDAHDAHELLSIQMDCRLNRNKITFNEYGYEKN